MGLFPSLYGSFTFIRQTEIEKIKIQSIAVYVEDIHFFLFNLHIHKSNTML